MNGAQVEPSSQGARQEPRPAPDRNDPPDGIGAEVRSRAAGDVTTPSGSSDGNLQWANSELSTIASTIEELQGRLAEANAQLTQASAVETTEVEIGRLFVEAQRYSEESLARLEAQVHEVLRDAETKAKQIIAEANEEAQEIRRQAHQSAFVSTRTAQDLQSAIAGFTGVNNALLKELGLLNSMLEPQTEHRASEHDDRVGSAPAIDREGTNGSVRGSSNGSVRALGLGTEHA